MQKRKRIRDYGITIGVLPTGSANAITDVKGVQIGQVTLIEDTSIRTGVTAVVPHGGNVFQEKVPAAIYAGNGFGKLVGSTQIQELGTLETPIILTNTLSVGVALNALVEYTLRQTGNETVQSVNAVIGETNDGELNDIRGRHVKEDHVLQALAAAKSGPVDEGNVGAGTGTVCFGFKGGVGTSSRKLPHSLGGYTVGVLAQTNFGGVLEVGGMPLGKMLKRHVWSGHLQDHDSADGSCMMVVATDAPLDARNLERVAARAMLGLAKTGGIAANGSGDYVLAFSTHSGVRIPHTSRHTTQNLTLLRNDAVSPLFLAAIEATEEAILNSLFAAQTMQGKNGHVVEALPLEEVSKLLKHHALAR
jgi:D-aminopeptidase